MDKQETERASRKQKKDKKKIADILFDPFAGFDVIIDKQLDVDFIINEEKQKNHVTLKVLVGRQKQIVKVQLSSQKDLFFYFEILISNSDLKMINSQHSMEIGELAEFVLMLEKYLEEAQKNEKQLLFEVKDQITINFIITKFINNKFFIVFSLNLSNQLAAYRYGCLRQQIADFQLKIKQVKQTIRSRNPYLLTFINKL